MAEPFRYRAGRWAALAVGTVFAASACGAASAPQVASLPAAQSTAAHGTATHSGTTGSAGPQSPFAYTHCMRAHGIADFPDPPTGPPVLAGQPDPEHLGGDLSPSNPANQAATRACAYLLGPPPDAAEMQAELARTLRWVQCLRTHGIKDAPDPHPQSGSSNPANSGKAPADMNPNNPFFQAANKACAGVAKDTGPDKDSS